MKETRKSTVALFHGTSGDCAESILDNGFKQGSYFALDREVARRYAVARSTDYVSGHRVRKASVIFEVEVSEENLEELFELSPEYNITHSNPHLSTRDPVSSVREYVLVWKGRNEIQGIRAKSPVGLSDCEHPDIPAPYVDESMFFREIYTTIKASARRVGVCEIDPD